jgi:hypothetical protein
MTTTVATQLVGFAFSAMRSPSFGISWWPGQLVVRVRERNSADAQEATGD